MDVYVEGHPIALGARASLRPVLGWRGVRYDTDQDRSAFAYGISAEYHPREALALRLGYFRRTGSGEGPFAFDALDIARELGLGLAARLGPEWRAEMLVRYDVGDGEFPVLDLTLIRVAHCLEYGVTWHKVRSEFGIRVGLARTGQVEAPGW